MADRVAIHTVLNSPKQLVVHLVCISDATGETDVIKVDKSTFLAADGAEPDALEFEWIDFTTQGFQYVMLEWDHTADDLALALSGSGFKDFTARGYLADFNGTEGLKDPRSAGGTGDLILTSVEAPGFPPPVGATYDITIGLRKNAS